MHPLLRTRSASVLLPEEILEVLVKPLVGLDHPRFHPRVDHPVAIFLRVEVCDAGQGRHAVPLLEHNGLDRDVTWRRFELERPANPLRPDDVLELAAKPELLPVGASMNDPPLAAGPEVYVAEGDLVLPRAPPVRHVLA